MPKVKKCLVIGCDMRSDRNNRNFFCFPRNAVMHKKWCDTLALTKSYSSASQIYVCDDHFDVS